MTRFLTICFQPSILVLALLGALIPCIIVLAASSPTNNATSTLKTTKIYFPFRIHEKDKMLLNDMEKEDLSGKFWIKMNYTYDIDEPFFTVKLTRFDVREGEQDNNFHGDIDRVWSESNGWPVDIVLSFPDIGASFPIPQSSDAHTVVNLPFHLPSAYYTPIPKIIHFPFVRQGIDHTKATLPHAIERSMSSFKEQNEDYTIRFIGSLELMRNDLFKLEGQAALDAFDTLSPMAFKVDLWRFVVIFHIGGVYCDSKLTLEQPLDILLSQHRFTNIASQSILVKDLGHAIQNSFMAMPAGSEYARRSIDAIIKNVETRSYKGGPHGITGPVLLMKVFGRLEVKDKSFYHFLDLENSVFDITISSQAPGQEDTTRLRKDRVVIFHNGEYRRHSKSTGAGGYPEMFHNCQIYGETEASSSCHDHNSATTITSPNGSTSAGEVRMVVLLSSWALLVLFTLIN